MQTRLENRKFGWLVGGTLLAIGCYPLYKNNSFTFLSNIVLMIGVVLVGAGFLVPGRLNLLRKSWIRAGHILGWINNRIILGFIFFLIVWPIGIILRLCGKDPMRRKLDKSVTTYRILSSNDNLGERLTRTF